VRNSLPTGQQRGARGFPLVDVTQNCVQLFLRDLRSLLRLRLPPWPDLAFFGRRDRLGDELIVHTVLDEYTGPGAAALALVQEETGVGVRHSIVNIGIVENYSIARKLAQYIHFFQGGPCTNDRALATELECDPLHVVGLRRGHHDLATDAGRAGEGKLVEARVGGHQLAAVVVPRQDIDHPRRQTYTTRVLEAYTNQQNH
jgi:hypothetical protein